MMKNNIQLLLLFSVLLLPLRIFCQTTGTVSQNASEQADTSVKELPSMSEQYFEDVYTLDRNYEYQLFNKKRRLQMWAFNTASISIALMLGGGILSVELSLMYGWKDWTLVPCVLVSMTPLVAGMVLFRYLLKRANAIDVNSLTYIPLNDKLSLGLEPMAYQFTTSCTNYQSAGIGITLNF